eukprot:jgi/Tetstr1/456409/TSEL_043143.t1
MSTSITTGMMNTPLPNLAGRSAVKKDPGSDPPPPDFSDSDTSSEGAFSLHGASDSDSSDIQWIKPSAVKPTLDLATVPVWDLNISTRDNAQAIKISLGSAGYLDTTKGKGTRQEQLILLAGFAIEERRRLEEEITTGQLPNEPVHVYVRRCRNLWNLLRKAHGQWTFEYVTINYLIPRLHPTYDHIVDATISATNVNKRLATIISAGQNMEARTRQRQQRARSRTPTFNSCDPRDQLYATRPNIVCSSGLPVMLTCTTTAPGGAATGAQEREGEDDEDDEDIRNCVNNVAAIKLADPGPFSGYNIYNPEGDATALPAPHTNKHAQLPSHYVDFSDYHPTLVASAIAAVVRPHSARLTALALPAPTVRVSTAPRTYHEDICSTRPDDWKTSMNHEINSIATMALFVWVNVPELRRNNKSAVIQQMAWAFAAQHKDGNIIRREAGVIVRGNLFTTGETYNDAKTYAPIVHFVALRTNIAITVQLT